MACITKIVVVETTIAIWEYDPSLPNNCISKMSNALKICLKCLKIPFLPLNPYFKGLKAIKDFKSFKSRNLGRLISILGV